MGSISPLFDKMLAIHNKHGPFELALCVGDFFGPLSGDNDSDDVGRLLGGELRGSSQFFVCQKLEPELSQSKLQCLVTLCRASTLCLTG